MPSGSPSGSAHNHQTDSAPPSGALGVFISWAPHCSRSDSIAVHLGLPSFMVYAPFWGSHYSTILLKYLTQSIQTIRILVRERPGTVFVMTPPVIACVPVWLYCTLTGAGFIIDAHTGAFLDPRWRRLLFVHRFFSRRALATLVTNSHLQQILEAWRAPSIAVADVPVRFPPPAPVAGDGAPTMTLVSSFDRDEPIEAFMEAARSVSDVTFYVTGDHRAGRRRAAGEPPDNVRFTGFLPAGEYVGRLIASDAVISLTTLEHTMQRGAYEAVYLERPVIVSDTELLKKAFHPGAVHVDNTPAGIARGIRQMLERLETYREEVRALKRQKLDAWAQARARLRALVDRSQLPDVPSRNGPGR